MTTRIRNPKINFHFDSIADEDGEDIFWALGRDAEIESGAVSPISHAELMNHLRGNGERMDVPAEHQRLQSRRRQGE
ncbi:MAG: hypothetical protein ACLFQQ_09195 [Desulfococcaceae bacterium]